MDPLVAGHSRSKDATYRHTRRVKGFLQEFHLLIHFLKRAKNGPYFGTAWVVPFNVLREQFGTADPATASARRFSVASIEPFLTWRDCAVSMRRSM